jgi:hypothetical protein
MHQLVRTNDLVLLSRIEALLDGEDIPYLIADGHMSALEGSVGFLPRRVLVRPADRLRARRLLTDFGLGEELAPEGSEGG